MVNVDEHSAPPPPTVQTSDSQTGLPTLIGLCSDLRTLLNQPNGLALAIFYLDHAGRPSGALDDAQADAVAQLATEAAQQQPQGRAYRMAADSFALVLPGLHRPPAIQLAEALRGRIERLGMGLTATFAVASAPADAAEIGALIAVCEVQLLYMPQGRNHVYAAMPVESLPPSTSRLVNLLVGRMMALIELGQRLDETEHRALHDPTSGLPNSRSFEQTLPRMLARCDRLGQPLALLLIDGDNLKHYNTHFGYDAGNEWIRRVAQMLRDSLRPEDYVARWLSGDEFVVLLPATHIDEAREIAEHLRLVVQQVVLTNEIASTVSIGVAVSTGAASDAVDLQVAARRALLAAKALGKNRVVLADPIGQPAAHAAAGTAV